MQPFRPLGPTGGTSQRHRRGRFRIAHLITSMFAAVLGAGCSQSPEASLLEKARSAQEGEALLIGDSIVLGYRARMLCGKRLFNAGLSGTGAREWKLLAPRLIEELKPSLVVVSLGIVDARRGVEPGRWAGDYEQVASAADLLVSIAPVEHDKIAERPISDAVIAQLNRKIVEAGKRNAAPIVPPIRGEALTTDGIHLNRAGYRAWGEKLSAACPE